MTAQAGVKMLLQLKLANNSYATLGGLRVREMTFNRSVIDVTAPLDTYSWRQLMDAGVRQLEFSGSGIFVDSAAEQQIRNMFRTGAAGTWRGIIPDFLRLDGKFLLSEMTYRGEYDGEVSWDLTLLSAGDIALTDL